MVVMASQEPLKCNTKEMKRAETSVLFLALQKEDKCTHYHYDFINFSQGS